MTALGPHVTLPRTSPPCVATGNGVAVKDTSNSRKNSVRRNFPTSVDNFARQRD